MHADARQSREFQYISLAPRENAFRRSRDQSRDVIPTASLTQGTHVLSAHRARLLEPLHAPDVRPESSRNLFYRAPFLDQICDDARARELPERLSVRPTTHVRQRFIQTDGTGDVLFVARHPFPRVPINRVYPIRRRCEQKYDVQRRRQHERTPDAFNLRHERLDFVHGQISKRCAGAEFCWCPRLTVPRDEPFSLATTKRF